MEASTDDMSVFVPLMLDNLGVEVGAESQFCLTWFSNESNVEYTVPFALRYMV